MTVCKPSNFVKGYIFLHKAIDTYVFILLGNYQQKIGDAKRRNSYQFRYHWQTWATYAVENSRRWPCLCRFITRQPGGLINDLEPDIQYGWLEVICRSPWCSSTWPTENRKGLHFSGVLSARTSTTPHNTLKIHHLSKNRTNNSFIAVAYTMFPSSR